MENVKTRFERLFKEYRGKVYALAIRFTGNREDALDLVQDVFLKVYTALPRNGIHCESAWIYRITTNACVDWLRKKRRDAHPLGVNIFPSDNENGQIKDLETHDLLRQALKNLSPVHRRVIILRWIKGLTYREIAAEMGCSIGTVMSRLHYARKNLRQYLRTLSSA